MPDEKEAGLICNSFFYGSLKNIRGLLNVTLQFGDTLDNLGTASTALDNNLGTSTMLSLLTAATIVQGKQGDYKIYGTKGIDPSMFSAILTRPDLYYLQIATFDYPYGEHSVWAFLCGKVLPVLSFALHINSLGDST